MSHDSYEMSFDLVNPLKVFGRQPRVCSVKTLQVNPQITRDSLLAILLPPFMEG